MVSVIIPNYNHANYLKQRIDSVLNQSYPDIEVIILDDCSADNSRDIIEEYRGHPKVSHVLFNEKNSGSPFRQWKRGVELARGEFIWIAESDDVAEPGFLETVSANIISEPGIVLSYCQSILFSENFILGRTEESFLIKNITGKQWVLDYMLGQSGLVNASMALFKREAALKVSWEKFEDYKLCGDWFFWVQIASHGKVAISGKYLNYFRKHKSSASNSPSRQGGFYKEGITIFHWSVQNFKLEKEQINKGLANFVEHLFYNFSEISDQHALTESWSIIKAINPDETNRIVKKLKAQQRKQNVKKFFQGAIKVLKN